MLPEVERQKIIALKARIPEDLQGLFQLLVRKTETTHEIYGLRIQGDPALEACQALSKHTLEPRAHKRHGNHLSQVFTGAEFDTILHGASPRETEKNPLKYTQKSLQIRTKANPTFNCFDDSIPLAHIDQLRGLSPDDQRVAQKIIAAIPANIRGAFAFDLAKHGADKPSLGALTLFPMMPLNMIHKILSTPLVSHPSRLIVFDKTQLTSICTQLPNPTTGRAM